MNRENGVEVARSRGVVHLVNSTLQTAKFHPNIGLFDVIEHIKDDVEFLREINRILDNEGTLFITVPAFDLLWSQNDMNAQHFRRYTLKSFSSMAAKAGFKTIYSTYFFSLLPLAIFFLRVLPYRLGIRFSNVYSKAAKEHKAERVASVMDWVGAKEIKTFKKGKKVLVGSSCLLILRKANIIE